MGAVWTPLLEVADWSGPILVPDLRGHGASQWPGHYSFGAMAADVAELIEPGSEVVLFGHSMGGVVALTLASGLHRLTPRAVMTQGLKPFWTEDELVSAEAVATKAPRRFDDREAAEVWALKLAGLHPLAEAGLFDVHAMVANAVRPVDDGWIAGHDPRSLAIGAPPLAALHAAISRGPAEFDILHCAGGADEMVSGAPAARGRSGVRQLADATGAPTHEFPGLGHNAIVEDPEQVWARFRSLVGPLGS